MKILNKFFGLWLCISSVKIPNDLYAFAHTYAAGSKFNVGQTTNCDRQRQMQNGTSPINARYLRAQKRKMLAQWMTTLAACDKCTYL